LERGHSILVSPKILHISLCVPNSNNWLTFLTAVKHDVKSEADISSRFDEHEDQEVANMKVSARLILGHKS
ncbi:hypothetical protein BaRGS_00007300, partial [Batillaria attramentaria]